MSWPNNPRPAKSLTVLLNQVNNAYPNRTKISDGLLGDAAHAASASDHNPNRNGVVCALDLTHDPANGFDAHALAEHLRVNRHPNLRYVISNARIAGYWNNWQWEKSSGHYQHCHISVGTHWVSDGQTYDNYDSTVEWNIGISKEDAMDANDVGDLFQIARGQNPTQKELNQWVGKPMKQLKDVLRAQPSWQDSIKNQQVGAVARRDNWEKQIKDLRAKNKELSKNGTTLKPGVYIVK